jgi:hypothetical protein
MADAFDTGFKPGELHIDYPVWVPFDSRTISPLGKPDVNGLVLFAPGDGPRFILIFTDWDLTLRFITRYNPVACGLPFGKANLEKLLVHFEQAGDVRVAFDVEPPNVRFVTVADALAAVRWQNQ